jgi:hypothetical protein
MARFPFEEDTRFRFGAFHELVRRYIFIGREPPADRRPPAKPVVGRRSTPRIDRSRPPVIHRGPGRDAFVVHAGQGAAP